MIDLHVLKLEKDSLTSYKPICLFFAKGGSKIGKLDAAFCIIAILSLLCGSEPPSDFA